MRKSDVWVGRIAAAAGLFYVVVCSLRPLKPTQVDVRHRVARRGHAPVIRSA